ncbi:MAG: hypothetical protein ACRD9R_11860 [Pyrinomonadaceae bacterium]
MKETLLNLLVLAAILGASWLVTNWFARTMYNRCRSCGTLNARRRQQCRSCRMELQR